MDRRTFIGSVAGGLVAVPFTARAQQPKMPVIGFVHLMSPGSREREVLAAFYRGLSDTGYTEGKNVALEYLWAEGQNDRLSSLVAEMVRRQVSVIAALESTNSALAAKAATQTIPIVFMQAADPVRIGLVGSFNQPGGNVTGIVLLGVEVAAKRLELLLELVPVGTAIAYLRNPTNPVFAENETRETQIAARARGVSLLFVNVSHQGEFEKVFANLVQQNVGALLVSADGFLSSHRDQIVALTARHSLPAIYGWPAPGGLVCYTTNYNDAWRLAGVYIGRILKGEKPANMPVYQVTNVDLIINLKTAKALGITIPQSLLLRADEVIQ
jgi:putative ABC transport system substrate-binding protein